MKPPRLADEFTPGEIDALIITVADLYTDGHAGNLSERQRELAERASALTNEE